MINLFSFASNDQSLVYLYDIFGSMNNIIVPASLPPTSYAILGAMFKVFNSTILAVGALAVLYVTVMSVVMTAHEGEFMGKKWNNIWIFVRIVFAIALMVPSSSGYCAIQFIMMWVIVQGIGAADVLWTSALNYVNVFGSVYTQPTVPTTGTSNNMQGLFETLVCDAAARFTQHDPTKTPNGDYFCAANNTAWCGSSIPQASANMTSISFGPGGGAGTTGGACGSLTYCDANAACSSDPTSMTCETCNAQINALNSTITALSQIAAQLVQADYTYRLFWNNSGASPSGGQWPFIQTYCSSQNPPIPPNQCCVPNTSKMALQTNQTCQANNNFTANYNPNDSGYGNNLTGSVVTDIIWPYAMSNISNPNGGGATGAAGSTGGSSSSAATSGSDFISVIVNDNYQKALSDAISGNGSNQANSKALSGTLQTAQQEGWIFAGSFYYSIASMNNANTQAAVPTLNYGSPSPQISDSSNPMSKYRNDYNAASALVGASSGNGVGGNQQVAQTTGALSSSMGDVTTAYKSNVNPSQGVGSNPLARLQTWGMIMLITAEVTFVVLLVGGLLAGLFGNLGDIFALGNGMINPVGPALLIAFMFLVPVALGFLGILVTYGGLLAVYAPLIPYIIWVTAVIGWFIAVIEAMVAGPLVALGMLSPNTQGHEILGKSEPALAHLFAIFLRPSLLVFGLIAALLLSSTIVAFIDATFGNVEGAVGEGHDPLGMILFYGAYIALLVGSLNKSFATIHIIPQQVLTWMGLHHQGVGGGFDEALVGAAKGGVEQAGGYASAGMKGGSALAQKGGTAIRGKAMKQNAQGVVGGAVSPPPPPPPPPSGGAGGGAAP